MKPPNSELEYSCGLHCQVLRWIHFFESSQGSGNLLLMMEILCDPILYIYYADIVSRRLVYKRMQEFMSSKVSEGILRGGHRTWSMKL